MLFSLRLVFFERIKKEKHVPLPLALVLPQLQHTTQMVLLTSKTSDRL